MDKVCDICGGSGQIGIFRGLSRFVIGWEECPECYGTGLDNPTGEVDETSKRYDIKDRNNGTKENEE